MELEPCPWCGSVERLSLSSCGSLTADMPNRPYKVLCTHIDHDTVEGPVAYGKAEAIAAWNRRTPPASQSDEFAGTAVSRDEADPNGYGAGTSIEQQTGPDNCSVSNAGEGGSIPPPGASQSDEALMADIAMAMLNLQGFPFATDPMEYGQDAYDITQEALTDARAILPILHRVRREGIEEAAKGDSYAAWQQKRGMLADTVDWAVLEYDEFMKDDAYDAQRVLDRIIERLRSTRSALTEKQP